MICSRFKTSIRSGAIQSLANYRESPSIHRQDNRLWLVKGPCKGCIIRGITPRDHHSFLDFLRKWFYRDEPLNQTVGLINRAEERSRALDKYVLSYLPDDVSLLAEEAKHHSIIGAQLNGIAMRSDPVDSQSKLEMCDDIRFRRILHVLMYVDKHSGIWKYVSENCQKIIEVQIVSTHGAWRRRGLMRLLVTATEDVARAQGCGAARMIATSAFSAAVAENLGYKRIYRVPFADIPPLPSLPPIIPPKPHTHANVYVKILK